MLEAFRAGKVAFMPNTELFYTWMEDKTKSEVAGKIGYAPIPTPMIAPAWGHGLAISTVGAKTEAQRAAAGEFIGWVSSKEIEMQKLAKNFIPLRTSTRNTPLMKKMFPKDLLSAMDFSNTVSKITFWRIPEWPEIGDNLGIVLEQIYTGQRTDIQAGLDDAVEFAKQALSK
jgi:multiple sugar transport system substrate-binding protein